MKIHVSRRDGRTVVRADLRGRLTKEDGMWVSTCERLGVMTCGKTKAEALENTKEAIVMFFGSCIKHVTLDKALTELGWNKAA